MYSTCLSCHAPLGANEMIEHFPIGRKVAFDQSRGRLWAVCTVCRQWNLAALDERWEAIEEAARHYRAARLRSSTDNIGLARLGDGTELIQIGEAKRTEFAAWRYGERFAARWRVRGPAAAVVGGAALVFKKVPVYLMVQLGQVAIIPVIAIGSVVGVSNYIRTRRAVGRVPLASGRWARVTQAHVEQIRVEPDAESPQGWRLRVKHSPVGEKPPKFHAADPFSVYTGEEATRIAAQLLPRMNRTGGRRSTVAEAVSVLERAGDPEQVFRMAADYLHSRLPRERSKFKRWSWDAADIPDDRLGSAPLFSAPAPYRLATEMAANEEQERQLMQGELKALEDQWREAEEIAAIADQLTLPPAILRQLERLRVR